MDSWGLYSVTVTAVVHDDDVANPWEEFVCTLTLPPANFTSNRTTVYYPGTNLLLIFLVELVISDKLLMGPTMMCKTFLNLSFRELWPKPKYRYLIFISYLHSCICMIKINMIVLGPHKSALDTP